MSLYEALDQFVGAGVLACAAVVGHAVPDGQQIDGSAFSQHLRERRCGEEIGFVLDAFAHEIWLAQDQRGFPQRVCEAHAAGLAPLLGLVRLTPDDLLPAVETARNALATGGQSGRPPARQQLAEIWLARARPGGHLLRAGLIEDVARFLLETLFHHVIEQPRLLTTLKPLLADYMAHPAIRAASPAPAGPPQPAALPPAPKPPASPVSAAPAPAPAPAQAPPSNAVAAPPVGSQVAQIKARHGIGDGALRRFQAILATQAMTGEQRLARLDELAAWLVTTVAQLTRPANDPPELARLKAEAAAALNAGDFERAMDLLREVRSHLREGRRRTEARLAEEIEALRQQMIEEAAAAARMGELALARCEYDTAAALFEEAAGNLPITERKQELEYRQRQAETLAAKAETTGDTKALSAAAAAFRKVLELIDRSEDPSGWARNNVGLGDMLVALGTRDTAASRELEQAAVAYEAAVAAIDRAAHPMRWALVQLSRAVALIEIGNRGERDRNWLAAASILMPALEVFESRNAADLAEAARSRLRVLHAALEPAQQPRALPAKSA